ncbi:MAG: hypothetical protein KA715_09940 [Xanthomonadaceae bacterium]|nr:hypothetical protein [Xanthomonadaceae bacterium]
MNKNSFTIQNLALITLAAAVSGCTAQVTGSIKFKAQQQNFAVQQKVNTKIDLLWVIDNSASMDSAQDKLRQGLTGFAQKYMKPYWDIRIGVITTDSYIANSAFNSYLNTTIPGTTNWQSPYVASRIATWTNPSWAPTLVDGTGHFTNGIKFNQLFPLWDSNYSKLITGKHDGPIQALCVESLPYFMNGPTQCQIRDNPANANYGTGTSNCLNPGSGKSAISQCVNTVSNDSIRSGKAIISTKPPTGTPGDSAWVNSLVNQFMINATAGSAGHGSERGLASLGQFITDNEASGSLSSFFRADSVRGIIFISDEEDQSMTLPSPVPSGFTPWTNYRCDQAGLVALNPTANITGSNGVCCSGGSCSYGTAGTTCTEKTVDGFTYTPSICPVAANLTPVSTFKTQLDNFFNTLDGSTTTSSYFIVSIVALSGQTIQDLQAARTTTDAAVGATKMFAVDRADRYIALGDAVGNGSVALDMGASDYSPLLDAIGSTLVSKKSTFKLTRQATDKEAMVVTVVHANGTSDVVPSSILLVSGNTVTITDEAFVLSLGDTDVIAINYLPSRLFN